MLCVAAQLCLTLCDPVDYSLPGSSAPGIFQVRILEWVAVSSSGNLPDIGIELASPVSPALQVDLSLSTEPLRECDAKVHCPLLFARFSQSSRSAVSDSLQPHGLQHARPSCPSPTPAARSNSCLSSQ